MRRPAGGTGRSGGKNKVTLVTAPPRKIFEVGILLLPLLSLRPGMRHAAQLSRGPK
jgi:hypothetical protein